jgi:hypothetical protein
VGFTYGRSLAVMRNRLLVAVVVLILCGAATVAVAGGNGDPESSPDVRSTAEAEREPAPPRPPVDAPPPAAVPDVVMVRRAQGIPERWAGRARSVRGVQRVVRVRRGQALLRRTADGAAVSTVRAGYAIPVDTLVASPRAYASTLPSDVSGSVAHLGPREAVLSRTGARLRRAGRGAKLTLAGGTRLRVRAVVDDAHLNGAEMLVARSAPGVETRAAHMLVRLARPEAERSLKRVFRGERVRIVGRGGQLGTTRGRIVRPAELKERFGEVAVRLPYGGDWVRLDPAWVRRNIVAATVPILGTVSCNRRIVPDLRAAMRDVQRRHLDRVVDRGDYGGCYAPRRIPTSGSLSLHALGLAIDLNASTNGQYREGDQDPRLVRIMERHGFTWGGRWPTAPDPMHSEWQGS